MSRESFSLKDELFNVVKVAYLGSLLEEGLESFDRSRFEAEVFADLHELELKQRISRIAEVLAWHLDPRFTVAAGQIRSVLPPPLDPTLDDDDFGDFIFAPLGKYVEDHGIEHFDLAMSLLQDLTMRFSMEGSVRPFIDRRPEETLRMFEEWARHDHYHVRRLVSESTRPLLPWAPRIGLEVSKPFPLLDTLHADSTRYVTRSVANHLNDISKIEPPLVIEALTRWHREGRQEAAELEWMTRHALRTMVKRDSPEAMDLLGYSPEPEVDVGPITVGTPTVRAGEALEFSVTLKASGTERLLVDYAIEFVSKKVGPAPGWSS
jgi:3-methyladenine DNA glycosylase AlkC